MSLSDLIKKPAIVYTPEEVTLSSPGTDLVTTVATDSIYSTTATQNGRSVVIDLVTTEIAKLDEMIDAVSALVTDDTITIDEELQEAAGVKTVTLSTYLQSLHSTDYGPQIIREAYESQALDSTSGDPGILALSILDTLKEQLSSDLYIFSNNVSYSVPEGSRTDVALQTAMLRAVSQSQDVRAEVINIGYMADKALSGLEIINALSEDERNNISEKLSDLADALRAFKKVAQIATVCYALDWKSSVNYCRSYIFGTVAQKANLSMAALLSKFDNLYINPLVTRVKSLTTSTGRAESVEKSARKYLSGATTKENYVDMTSVHRILCLLLKVVDKIDTEITEKLTDIYTSRVQLSNFALSSAKSTKSLIFARKLVLQLDAVITTLDEVSDGTVAQLKAELDADVSRNDKCSSVKDLSLKLPSQVEELVSAGKLTEAEPGDIDYSFAATNLLYSEDIASASSETATGSIDTSVVTASTAVEPTITISSTGSSSSSKTLLAVDAYYDHPYDADDYYWIGEPGLPGSVQLDPKQEVSTYPWETYSGTS